MLTKIKRQDCLIQYPKFPQAWYNKIKDDEEVYYPNVISGYWVTLNAASIKRTNASFVKEVVSFLSNLGFNKLIFFGDYDAPWITKLSLSRNDYKPLTNAVEYLLNNKIGKRFNGAIEVERSEFSVFIKHFYCLVRCDGDLP